MPNFRADLHTHTCYSDGTATPRELIDLAVSYSLKGLSITDHDTVNAYREAIPYAKEKGLSLLSGVEFSSTLEHEPIHILGYSFSLDHPALLSFCSLHRAKRLERNQAILEKLRHRGLPISEEEFQSLLPSNISQEERTIGRPHIAFAMVEMGYVKNVQEAFHKYLGEGKECFVEGFYFPVDETIDIIHQAKGFAILAHPHLIKHPRIIRRLLEKPFDGLEGYYARLPHQQEEKWISAAKKRGWIITGGSDYHGGIKPANPLGASWVPEETFEILYQRSAANSST